MDRGGAQCLQTWRPVRHYAGHTQHIHFQSYGIFQVGQNLIG